MGVLRSSKLYVPLVHSQVSGSHPQFRLRITHAYLSSGLLPSQLERFLKAVTLDTLLFARMKQNVNQYAMCVAEERTASVGPQPGKVG